MSANDEGYKIAIEEGRQGIKEGGVGVGSCIVGADGKILGRGHNMRYAIPSLAFLPKLKFVQTAEWKPHLTRTYPESRLPNRCLRNVVVGISEV